MNESMRWPIHVLGLAAVAFTLGGSASEVLAFVAKGALTVESRSGAGRSVRPRAEQRDFHEASARNIFGIPVLVGADTFVDAPAAPESMEEEIPEFTDEVVTTDLPLGLVGTSVFGNPADSLASIVDLQDKRSGSEIYALRECGDRPCASLPGGAILKSIEVERILLLNTELNRLEELRLDGEKKKVKKFGRKSPPKSLPKPPAKKKTEPKPHGYDIRKVGENSYEIPRSEIGKALGDMSKLSRQARVVPVAGGFKLAWIRKGSVFESLGIKKGDVIKSANGYDVGTMDGAMKAFGKLKDAEDVTLDLERGGTKVTVEYRVTD